MRCNRNEDTAEGSSEGGLRGKERHEERAGEMSLYRQRRKGRRKPENRCQMAVALRVQFYWKKSSAASLGAVESGRHET